MKRGLPPDSPLEAGAAREVDQLLAAFGGPRTATGDPRPVRTRRAGRRWRYPFVNAEGQLRNGWWVAVFFLVLASLVVPVLVIASQQGVEVSILHQAGMVAVASWVCQLLRRKPMAELTGRLDGRWIRELAAGSVIGSALMLLPALVLLTGGWVTWRQDAVDASALLPLLVLFAEVALAEELLFRGFVFQRLAAGLGSWPAQLLMSGYFLLTHLDALSTPDGLLVLAAANIFLASVLFGLAFLRTGSLAMPLGLHLMANWMQGGVLGFGVSGAGQHGLLQPIVHGHPEWLTGGQFGLEASAPGLVCVLLAVALVARWKPATPTPA